MDEENELEDLLEPQDEHDAKMREIAYWASDVYEVDEEPRDDLLYAAMDDPEDDD